MLDAGRKAKLKDNPVLLVHHRHQQPRLVRLQLYPDCMQHVCRAKSAHRDYIHRQRSAQRAFMAAGKAGFRRWVCEYRPLASLGGLGREGLESEDGTEDHGSFG